MLLILSCLFLSAPGSKSSIQLSVELSLIFGILTLYCFIVAGIHDDASYFRLKNKYTIDNLETRMKNVKPFVDQIYVIPSTCPELYLKSMVSEQDIVCGSCCYARGDDMLNFPGREWVESVMPVHFVPRTESCSSTLIRTIYHADDPEIRKKAAFANTRYDGKPIDENGDVLKF